MRLFICIPLPVALRESLRSAQQWLKSRLPGPGLRWVAPEQIHLTLRFLGEVPESDLEQLRSKVIEAAQRGQPMVLQLAGAGCFPNPRRPRVIWIGLKGDLGQLRALQEAVFRQTKGWGDNEHESFHPHLTLARVKTLRPLLTRQLAELLDQVHVEAEWIASTMQLMRSHLGSEGARHEELECWQFRQDS